MVYVCDDDGCDRSRTGGRWHGHAGSGSPRLGRCAEPNGRTDNRARAYRVPSRDEREHRNMLRTDARGGQRAVCVPALFIASVV